MVIAASQSCKFKTSQSSQAAIINPSKPMQNICISQSNLDKNNDLIKQRAPKCPDCTYKSTEVKLSNGRVRSTWSIENDLTGKVYARGGIIKDPIGDKASGNRLMGEVIADSLGKLGAAIAISKGEISTKPKDNTSDGEKGSASVPTDPSKPSPAESSNKPKETESPKEREKDPSTGVKPPEVKQPEDKEPEKEPEVVENPDSNTSGGDDDDAWECSPLTNCIPPDDGSKIPDWIDPKTLPCAVAECAPISEIDQNTTVVFVPLSKGGKIDCNDPRVTCNPKEETIGELSSIHDKYGNSCYQPIQAPVKDGSGCKKGKPCMPEPTLSCSQGVIDGECKEFFCITNPKDMRCNSPVCNLVPGRRGSVGPTLSCVEQKADCNADPQALDCKFEECTTTGIGDCETTKNIFCMINPNDSRCQDIVKLRPGVGSVNCARDPYAAECTDPNNVQPDPFLITLCRADPTLDVCKPKY